MKKNIFTYLLLIIFGLTIQLASSMVAFAQGPADVETQPPVDTSPPITQTLAIPVQNLEEELLPPLLGIPPLPPDGLGVLELSLADLGSNDLEFRRDGSTASETFYLPSFVRMLPGAVLSIDYEYDSNAVENVPEITVDFNNENIGTLQLAGVISQANETLSLDNLIEVNDRNRLNFTLDTRTECGVKQPDVHALIYNTSRYRIPYQLVPLEPDLGRYPWPFFERTYRPIETYIVLPADPTSADLSAAATIGAGLGKLSRDNIAITSTSDISVTNEILQNHNLIIVGKPGTNQLLDQVTLPLALDHNIIEPEFGVIEEIQSPWNPYRMALVISGQTDQALTRASQALNRNIRFPGMSGPVAIVQDVLPPIPPEGEARNIDLTFADLDLEDQVVFGAVPRRLTVEFDLPRAFELVEVPQLFLSFNHSQVIDGSISVLDVYLNGIPVGTTLLEDANTVDGLLQVDLPAWQLKSGQNRLEIQVEMHLSPEENECQALTDSRLWTVIRNDSFIRLPYQAQSVQPTLALFPYPFDENVNLADVSVVIPPRPSVVEMQAMMDLAVNLGRSAGGDYIALDVTTPDEVSLEALNSGHTILIGRPSRNSLLRAINDQLPQPFALDSDLLEPTLDTVVLFPDPDQSVGLLEQVTLSDSSEAYILVVSGTTDEGVSLAVEALLTPNSTRAGTVTVVKSNGASHLGTQKLQIFSLDTENTEESQSQSNVKKVGYDAARLLALSRRWW
jgi:hypothetical protein